MRYGCLAILSPCSALGDYRMVICGRGRTPLLSISPVSLTPQTRWYRRNSLYNADPKKAIRPNSLKKTLEAHRFANRAKLIRKVYNDKPDPNVYRPLLHLQHTDDSVAASNTTSQNVNESKVKEGISQKKSLQRFEKEAPKPVDCVSLHIDGDRVAQYPWLDLIQPRQGLENAESRLNTEIKALAEYLTPSPPEQLTVSRIVREISDHVADMVPNAPQLVGSRSTQTALSYSDIDLMILVDPSAIGQRTSKPMTPKASKTFTSIIRKVEVEMRQISLFNDCHILDERSPMLIMNHKTSGLPVRIFCGNNIPHSDGYIKTCLDILPSLPPLYRVLRAILQSRNIFGWEKASVDSNGLILLIAAFLKQQSPEWRRRKGLGEQLLAILDTYGSKINLETTGVAVEPAGFFDFASVRESEKQMGESHPILVGQRALLRFKVNASNKANRPAATHLCIQDPTNYLNDAGLQCVRTAELQKIFSRVHRDLQSAVQKWDDGDQLRGSSILGRALHANFDDVKRIKTSMRTCYDYSTAL